MPNDARQIFVHHGLTAVQANVANAKISGVAQEIAYQ
jgi:hypothetical protein